jgi:hypothetical protein
MIRKTMGFISWKSWRPEILSISLILFKQLRILENILEITNFEYKNCAGVPLIIDHLKDSN